MNNDQNLQRPVGWWLKEADARLDAAFDAALSAAGADRRGWQVLATLRRSAAPRAAIVASLAAFDEPAVVEGVLEDLQRRGWVEESNAQWQLTPAGLQKHADLAPLVASIRGQVATALPDDDYALLIDLLARLVAGLPEPAR